MTEKDTCGNCKHITYFSFSGQMQSYICNISKMVVDITTVEKCSRWKSREVKKARINHDH